MSKRRADAPVLTQKRARELFDYNAETGLFQWRNPPNAAGGRRAVGTDKGDGYLVVEADYRRYPLHRLAWLYIYGVWPSAMIDHINRNPSDNRIRNLREANRQQNSANAGVQRNNVSGFRGVSPHRTRDAWCARIKIDGKDRWLGTYESKLDAARAYALAASSAFGEFAEIKGSEQCPVL